MLTLLQTWPISPPPPRCPVPAPHSCCWSVSRRVGFGSNAVTAPFLPDLELCKSSFLLQLNSPPLPPQMQHSHFCSHRNVQSLLPRLPTATPLCKVAPGAFSPLLPSGPRRGAAAHFPPAPSGPLESPPVARAPRGPAPSPKTVSSPVRAEALSPRPKARGALGRNGEPLARRHPAVGHVQPVVLRDSSLPFVPFEPKAAPAASSRRPGPGGLGPEELLFPVRRGARAAPGPIGKQQAVCAGPGPLSGVPPAAGPPPSGPQRSRLLTTRLKGGGSKCSALPVDVFQAPAPFPETAGTSPLPRLTAQNQITGLPEPAPALGWLGRLCGACVPVLLRSPQGRAPRPTALLREGKDGQRLVPSMCLVEIS